MSSLTMPATAGFSAESGLGALDPGWALLLGLALLVANGFFVGAEFALMAARRSTIEPLALAGHKWAVTVLWAMENVSVMLATAQLGITICSTSLGLIAEPAIANLLHGPLQAVGIDETWTHAIAFAIALLLVVVAHVVLGEMVPKNLAVAGPDRAVRWFGPPLVVIARALAPLVRLLNWAANRILGWFGVRTVDEVASGYTAEQVQTIVEQSAAEGVLRDDQGLLTGALEFSDHNANDVMVLLEDLLGVPEHVTPEQVESLVAATGFSRFPVTSTSGEPIGYLHLKDVLYADGDQRREPVPSWRVRSLVVVSPADQVEEVLGAMQRGASHLARVEAAGICLGVVFLEDVLEELVGEVRDQMQRNANDQVR